MPISAQDADGLVAAVARVTQCILQCAARYGLQLNLDEGKTEAVLAPRGHGTRHVKRQVYTDGGIRVGERLLCCVGRYKHLGTVAVVTGTEAQEVAARIASARSAENAARRPLLQNRVYATRLKTMVVDSLIYSRLFVAAGLWEPLSPTTMRNLRTAYLSPLRRVLWRPGPRSDDEPRRTVPGAEATAKLKVPPLAARLAAERLRAAARLSSSSPVIRALYHTAAAAPWIMALVADLQVLHRFQRKALAELPPPTVDTAPWEMLWTQWPRAWSALVGRFLADPAVHRHYLAQEAAELGADAGAEGEPTFACPCCPGDAPTIWTSTRALRAHMAAAHGRQRPAALVATGPVCPVCATDFHTRQRVMEHLERGPRRCRMALAAGAVPQLTADELAEQRRRDAERQRECRRSGTRVTDGPPCLPPGPHG